MKSMWLRIIKTHCIALESKNEPGFLKVCDSRLEKQYNENGEPKYGYYGMGSAYLEIYTVGDGFIDNYNHSKLLLFKAQIVNMYDDDFLVLHKYELDNNRITRSIAYIPWEKVYAIRYVSDDDTLTFP